MKGKGKFNKDFYVNNYNKVINTTKSSDPKNPGKMYSQDSSTNENGRKKAYSKENPEKNF